MARILICDDQEMMRDSLASTLVREGHEVTAASDGGIALQRLSAGKFDLLITDLKMPRMTGIELLAEAKKLRPEMPVVIMTAFATVQTAVDAMKQGAYDYIQKPFDGEEIKMLVDRTLEHNRLIKENATLRSIAETAMAPRPLIGSGVGMEEIRKRIELVARKNATVLIRGESGTGKELVARAIHLESERKDRPFLAVNCAALSENLLESELFGHEKGSFTGADKLRRGRFELADGGTLLLDEISEIVVPMDLPPLRDRADDVPELCRHFLHLIAKRERAAFRHIEPEAVRLLQKYNWPGNVRELQNIIERASVLELDPAVIRAETIEPWLRTRPSAGADGLANKPLADVEKHVILTTLERFKGHRMKTAHALGIGVRTLGMKLKKWKDEGELVETGA